MDDKVTILDSIINVAKIMNLKKHAENLSIPIFKGFKILKNENPQTILLASDQNFVEQILSDGPLVTNESFDDRIGIVIKNINDYIKSQNDMNIDSNIKYFTDYSNGQFNYKIYVQNMDININNTKKNTVQFHAFFIEPNFNDFYQISLSSTIENINVNDSDIDINNIENNSNIKKLYVMLIALLDNLKYKK